MTTRVPTEMTQGFPFTKSFTSAEQTITNGGLLTIAHGLDVIPALAQCLGVCKVAGGGHSVGDLLVIKDMDYVHTHSTEYFYGADLSMNNRNIYMKIGKSGLIHLDKSNDSHYFISSPDWKILVKAWA